MAGRDIDPPGASDIFRRHLVLTLTQHAIDAADQALEGDVIDLIGAAETVDDVGFSSLFGGIPDRLGEGVVGDTGVAGGALFQAAFWAWRSRRNWKNSRPSRSRRAIICGLVSISPRIDAIFGARK